CRNLRSRHPGYAGRRRLLDGPWDRSGGRHAQQQAHALAYHAAGCGAHLHHIVVGDQDLRSMEAEMVQLTRIYTRGGDKGKTSLGTGKRVAKHDLRVAAYGTVDEANSILALARLHLAEG